MLVVVTVLVALLGVQTWRTHNLKKTNEDLRINLSEVKGKLAGTEAGLKAVETIETNQKHRVEILTRNISDVRAQPVTTACIDSPSVSLALERMREDQTGSGNPR